MSTVQDDAQRHAAPRVTGAGERPLTPRFASPVRLRFALAAPGDAAGITAIRLGAYDAGEFYARSGYREVGRVSYPGVPLIYDDLLL